ncbi:MAG: hypothetical protein KKH32_09240 [Bacteroidetes bacterium]|nr:hypothetical protein [Bacteroidota bacterium]
MTNPHEMPTVRPGGLVTIAYLKAQLDSGSDHLGIFMPLILDVITQLQSRTFTTADIQDGLGATHGVAMPQQTITTLLKRAISKGYIVRESGRYSKNPKHHAAPSAVAADKLQIEQSQTRLADALRSHAERRGLKGISADAARDMLFRFLEVEQIAMLLSAPPRPRNATDTSLREHTIVAEFLQDVVKNDSALLSVLRGMLEGLVLYQAAFLPDLAVVTRRFKNLLVVFDSNLVRQALGYEGQAMRRLIRETVDVLKAGAVHCVVLDKTIHEIRRILSAYETRLGTAQGRDSLKPVPMARHFLTQRYSPSDVREMSALLESEIGDAGFEIIKAPARIPQYTAGEHALTLRLADPLTKDELQPRVVHDVDCVAAVLTFRKGHRSMSIDDAVAVFATASPLVIQNTVTWWQEDEHEAALPPLVHIRALANLAWLKKPLLSKDFKVYELVALCTAALRPTHTTWDRFIRHLDSLQKSQKLNSDEKTAILVSALSDQLLRDAETAQDDPTDIDAVTLDEVVDRVKASYSAKAEQERQMLASEFEGKLDQYKAKLDELEAREREATARAKQAEHTAAEEMRKRVLAIEGRARRWARRISKVIQWLVTAFVAIGAVILIFAHPFHTDWLGIVFGLAVVVFVVLEVAGILKHLSDLRLSIETRLAIVFRHWLGGD